MYRLKRLMSLVEKSNNSEACIVLHSSSLARRWQFDHANRCWYCGARRVPEDGMLQAVQHTCRDPKCKLGLRGVEVNFSFPAFNTPFG